MTRDLGSKYILFSCLYPGDITGISMPHITYLHKFTYVFLQYLWNVLPRPIIVATDAGGTGLKLS